MIVWPYDRLTLWLSDTISLHETLWSSDLMIVWPYDRLTLWSSDLMFVWTYDLTLCLSGETGELMIWPYVCPVKPYDRPCWWSSCWWLSANPPALGSQVTLTFIPREMLIVIRGASGSQFHCIYPCVRQTGFFQLCRIDLNYSWSWL